MGSPQFRSASTGTWTQDFGSAGNATCNVPVPAGAQAGDVVLIVAHWDNFGAGTENLPGFTKVAVIADTPVVCDLVVWWKRLTGNDTGQYSLSPGGDAVANDDAVLEAVCYSRVVTSGSPFDGSAVTARRTSTGSATPAVSLTTSGASRRVVHIAMASTNHSDTAPATTTYTPAAGFAERVDSSAILIADIEQLTAGSTGSITATMSTARAAASVLLALVGLDRIVTVGSGITGAALGAPTLLRGTVPLTVPAIPAPSAPPGATVRGRNTVTATSITSPAAVPAPGVSAGAVVLSPTSIAAPSAPPPPQVKLRVVAQPIPTAESVPAPAALVGDLTVPSIGTGQAFGTAALLPGAATVTVASTESAAAFGTASVQLSVAPQGLASAAAFGTATLLAGAVTITAASTASAAVVPSPWLQTQVLRPDGISGAEHVNGPQVLLRVVVDDGIPADLLIQSQPELLLGSAFVQPTSIGSGERFPVTVQLTLSIDPSARVVRGETAVSVVRYEVMMMARLPRQSGFPALLEVDAIDWLSIKWSNVLNRPQELELTCLIGGLTDPVLQRLRYPDRLATELHVYRDGVTVFAGPLMSGRKRGEQVTLTARGLLSYLRFMVIAEDFWVPSSTDQHLLVRSMVDYAQNLQYGHFGIDTSEALSSGVDREGFWKADELHNVADRVEELSGRRNGFDVEVNPATRRLQLWYPRKGVDRSTGDDAVVFDHRNITSDDVMFSVAPDDLASHAIGTGRSTDGNETLRAEAENTGLKAAFGRAVATQSFADATDQTTLQDYVNGLLDERDQTLWVPGPEVRVDPDSDPTSYDVGDDVWFDAGGKIGVSGKFRVHTRAIDVTGTGRESATLAFV